VGVGYTDLNWVSDDSRNTVLMIQSEKEMRESGDGLLGQVDAEEVSE